MDVTVGSCVVCAFLTLIYTLHFLPKLDFSIPVSICSLDVLVISTAEDVLAAEFGKLEYGVQNPRRKLF